MSVVYLLVFCLIQRIYTTLYTYKLMDSTVYIKKLSNHKITQRTYIIARILSTVVERRYFADQLSCPALDLQLTGDHLCR